MLLWPRRGGRLEPLRRNPRSHSLNTPTRPKELPGIGYPSCPEEKARSNKPAPEPPLVPFRLARLTNWQRTRQGRLGAGPWTEPFSEPMSDPSLGTPRPIPPGWRARLLTRWGRTGLKVRAGSQRQVPPPALRPRPPVSHVRRQDGGVRATKLL